jgi:hypothetical protein
MENEIPSGTKVLNYALVTFLVALPSMVLLYRWLVPH